MAIASAARCNPAILSSLSDTELEKAYSELQKHRARGMRALFGE
jgi:hypothetical protein